MYPRPQQPQENYAAPASTGHGAMPIRTQAIPPTGNMSANAPVQLPDLLTQAFHQTVRPYQEKIEQLESQLADMQAWVDQLEQQRAEVHSWIDKRGLRPGMSHPLTASGHCSNHLQTFPSLSQRSWTPPQPMPRPR